MLIDKKGDPSVRSFNSDPWTLKKAMPSRLVFSAEPLAEFKMYVFDTCILVAALRSRRGASFLILSAIRQGAIAGVLSEALFLEYADVLKRDQT